MEDINKIVNLIEKFAPAETAQPWDNSGFQIKTGKNGINKIMLALDVTSATVDEAVEKGCDMIISHHPLFFENIKTIEAPFIIKAIKNDISIYSAHTNLDIAKGGVTDYLAEKCGVSCSETVSEFVKYKKFDTEQDFGSLISELKSVFSLDSLKVVNPNRKTYNSIAFCSGSGGEFVKELRKKGIDVFVTGDIKYHSALDAENMSVIDLGHFTSEKIVVEIFRKILQNENVELAEATEYPAWENL